MLFSDVWSENAALVERMMEFHSNPPKLYNGFKTLILWQVENPWNFNHICSSVMVSHFTTSEIFLLILHFLDSSRTSCPFDGISEKLHKHTHTHTCKHIHMWTHVTRVEPRKRGHIHTWVYYWQWGTKISVSLCVTFCGKYWMYFGANIFSTYSYNPTWKQNLQYTRLRYLSRWGDSPQFECRLSGERPRCNSFINTHKHTMTYELISLTISQQLFVITFPVMGEELQ